MGEIINIVIWLIVICLLLRRLSKKAKRGNPKGKTGTGAKGTKAARRPARSTDGHVLRGEQDITCRQFGHRHNEEEEPATRFIVHDDPEDGYILLNGKKMRISEADRYENSI